MSVLTARSRGARFPATSRDGPSSRESCGVKLTPEQLDTFSRDGIIALPGWFDAEEIRAIEERLPALFGERCPQNIREKSSDVVRTAMGLHLRDELFARLVNDPRFVEPARQILGDVE